MYAHQLDIKYLDHKISHYLIYSFIKSTENIFPINKKQLWLPLLREATRRWKYYYLLNRIDQPMAWNVTALNFLSKAVFWRTINMISTWYYMMLSTTEIHIPEGYLVIVWHKMHVVASTFCPRFADIVTGVTHVAHHLNLTELKMDNIGI